MGIEVANKEIDFQSLPAEPATLITVDSAF